MNEHEICTCLNGARRQKMTSFPTSDFEHESEQCFCRTKPTLTKSQPAFKLRYNHWKSTSTSTSIAASVAVAGQRLHGELVNRRQTLLRHGLAAHLQRSE